MLSFAKDDFQIVASDEVFSGYFSVYKQTIRHRLFDGSWSQDFQREIFERGNAAAVLLYDPELEQVVMLEQFRIGAVSSKRSPWMVEVVAGIIDEGENARDVVIREALEEAGQKIEDLIEIADYFPSPGGCTEKLTLFCAKVSAKNAEGVFGLEHENEDIRTFTMSIAEIEKGLAEGLFENATCLIALQWLLLNREKLHKIWKNLP